MSPENNLDNISARPKLSEEEKEKAIVEAMDMVEKEMNDLAPVLVNVANEMIKRKPDQVVFLDKGARIFATPMRKFIREKMDDQDMPDFRFFDDGVLRNQFCFVQKNPADGKRYIGLQHSESLDKEIKEAFSFIEGKKTFVVDDTISLGREALLWVSAFGMVSKENPKTEVDFFTLGDYKGERQTIVHGDLFTKDIIGIVEKVKGFNLFIGKYETGKHFFSRSIPACRYIGDDVDPETRKRTGKILGINSILRDFYDPNTGEPNEYGKGMGPKEELRKDLNVIHDFAHKTKDLIYEKMVEADKKQL